MLDAELELTRAELDCDPRRHRLLDSEPVLQSSIDRRNPYVDPLSFIQIELLRRRRARIRPTPIPMTSSRASACS